MKFDYELHESMKEFLSLLREEYAIYKNVYEQAKHERAAIQELNLSSLRHIVEEKQSLMDKAIEVETRIGALRTVWEESKDFVLPTLSKDIKTFLDEFSIFMADLVAYEQENEKIFIEKNSIKEAELGQVRRAKQASQAYFSTESHIVKPQTNMLG